MTMDVEKIRNYTDEELAQQELTAREQLFRLRFQIRSGQQEGVKKLRELRKDVARMKTVARFRTLYGSSIGSDKAGAGRHVEGEKSEATGKTAGKTAAKTVTGKAAKKSAGKKHPAKGKPGKGRPGKARGKKAGPAKTANRAAGKKAAAKKAGTKKTTKKRASGGKAGK
jgi:large subunit ribosomal protein L29